MKMVEKDSYDIIEKKLALAELTIELGVVTRRKWHELETLKDILKQEEDLLKAIAEASKHLTRNL